LFLVLRKEYRMRMFQDRVLTSEFRSKRSDAAGGFTTLHGEELGNLASKCCHVIE
jgi:hypothetical protein